jgi:RNA 2',3'-cyclic 3'-phosphodiesterase
VREQLAAWARASLRGLGARAGAPASSRVLDPELLHITLCFLGSRPLVELEAIGEALASCTEPVGELSLGAPLWLPVRRPRSLAVEVHDDEDGGLRALQHRLAGALERACGFREERRRFRPHVTVARIRDHPERRARATSARRGAGEEPAGKPTLPPTPALSFVVAELVLYRSWLSRDGASYEPLVTQAL